MNFKGVVEFRGASSPFTRRPVALSVWVVLAMLALLPRGALASGGNVPLPKQDWPFKGIFGKFDTRAIKRGAEVAVGICLACHSMKYIKFDQLRQFGFTEVEVKTLAESHGRTKMDNLISSMDPISAQEAFGVTPPDLSLMTKARKGYEDYSYGILTGYAKDTEMALAARVLEDGDISDAEALEVVSALHLDVHDLPQMKSILTRINAGETFNRYFPGYFFSMPQPLFDGAMTYADSTEATLAQMSHDVVTFMAWAAEPSLMERKSLGVKVILYLLLLTVMLYAVKRRVWAKLH